MLEVNSIHLLMESCQVLLQILLLLDFQNPNFAAQIQKIINQNQLIINLQTLLIIQTLLDFISQILQLMDHQIQQSFVKWALDFLQIHLYLAVDQIQLMLANFQILHFQIHHQCYRQIPFSIVILFFNYY